MPVLLARGLSRTIADSHLPNPKCDDTVLARLTIATGPCLTFNPIHTFVPATEAVVNNWNWSTNRRGRRNGTRTFAVRVGVVRV